MVRVMSRHELEVELGDLVERAGMPLEELKRRGSVYDLTVEQGDILDEVKIVEFLLEDD